MYGFRTIGSRKRKMIEGPLNRELKRLHKHGIDGMAFLAKKYGINKTQGFIKVNTKQMSEMISDLVEVDVAKESRKENQKNLFRRLLERTGSTA